VRPGTWVGVHRWLAIGLLAGAIVIFLAGWAAGGEVGARAPGTTTTTAYVVTDG
jgi:hypothetical protein